MDPVELLPILPGPITTEPTQSSVDGRAAAASDFDSFLTLLTAQLRNQDPLSPLDSTEFVAQLASFSGVEQQIGTNERLDVLAQQTLGGDIASFAGWIGKSISLADGSFRATGEEVSFAVPRVSGTEGIRATVLGKDGTALAQFDLAGNSETGLWDGRDGNGAVVVGRDVRIELSYLARGSELALRNAEVPREVTGLRGTANGIVLDLEDGGEAAPEAVARLAQ